MAKARRSSAEQSHPSGAHDHSEGQPTAKATTAHSTKARVSQSSKGVKDSTNAASRKPRGAAASASRAGNPEAASAFPRQQPKGPRRAAAAHDTTVSPASASSQAIGLSRVALTPASLDRAAVLIHQEHEASKARALAQRPTWSLLPTPAERFHGWIASHADADAALNALCSDLVEQTRSLLAFCKEHGFAYMTVSDWLHDEAAPHRSVKYLRAREARAEVMADEVVEISDEQPLTRDPETGAVTLDAVQIARNRQRAEARKWHAGKMNARFADKQTIALGGAEGLPPVNHSHTVTFVAAQAAAPAQIVEEVAPLPRIEGGS